MKSSATDLFRKTYDETPQLLIRSPGRVNLIGEHTDYNDGFIFPLAIDYAIWLALSPTGDKKVSLLAGDLNDSASFSLESLINTKSGWIEYVKGVASTLQNHGYVLSGWKGCILSNLPIGSSLSSSAALEMAVVKAFSEVSGFAMSPERMAMIGRTAENEWVGMNCGIMDQLASACGISGHALFIDCRSIELEAVPLPGDAVIAVLDTSTRRKLVESEYNIRREQCETAARYFNIPALRDLEMERLQADIKSLDDRVGRRALHIVSENDRVLSTVQSLKENDIPRVGELMYESHVSLRDLYEVSSTELNHIVESAMESVGCYGARMTGAGFGGCGVALVEKDCASSFSEEVISRYKAKSGLDAEIFVTPATAGTELIGLD